MVGVADAGQVGVAPPGVEGRGDGGAGPWVVGIEGLRPGDQLGLQPAEGPATPFRPGRVVELRYVVALTSGGHGGGGGHA